MNKVTMFGVFIMCIACLLHAKEQPVLDSPIRVAKGLKALIPCNVNGIQYTYPEYQKILPKPPYFKNINHQGQSNFSADFKEEKFRWDANKMSLEISSVEESDSGIYKCRVVTDNEEYVYRVELIVYDHFDKIYDTSIETIQTTTVPMTKQSTNGYGDVSVTNQTTASAQPPHKSYTIGDVLWILVVGPVCIIIIIILYLVSKKLKRKIMGLIDWCITCLPYVSVIGWYLHRITGNGVRGLRNSAIKSPDQEIKGCISNPECQPLIPGSKAAKINITVSKVSGVDSRCQILMPNHHTRLLNGEDDVSQQPSGPAAEESHLKKFENKDFDSESLGNSSVGDSCSIAPSHSRRVSNGELTHEKVSRFVGFKSCADKDVSVRSTCTMSDSINTNNEENLDLLKDKDVQQQESHVAQRNTYLDNTEIMIKKQHSINTVDCSNTVVALSNGCAGEIQDISENQSALMQQKELTPLQTQQRQRTSQKVPSKQKTPISTCDQQSELMEENGQITKSELTDSPPLANIQTPTVITQCQQPFVTTIDVTSTHSKPAVSSNLQKTEALSNQELSAPIMDGPLQVGQYSGIKNTNSGPTQHYLRASAHELQFLSNICSYRSNNERCVPDNEVCDFQQTGLYQFPESTETAVHVSMQIETFPTSSASSSSTTDTSSFQMQSQSMSQQFAVSLPKPTFPESKQDNCQIEE